MTPSQGIRFITVCFLLSLVTSRGFGNDADAPELVRVAPVRDDLLALYIQEGRVERSRILPYVAMPGDVIEEGYSHYNLAADSHILAKRSVYRDGTLLGYLNGTHTDSIVILDRYRGAVLDPGIADRPESYSIGSTRREPVHPEAVYRKSKPNSFARSEARVGVLHTIYLRLSEPMEEGSTYTITFPDLGLATASADFTYSPLAQRSEAVHVNQVGFAPGDPVKRAYVSLWLGQAGGLEFDGPLTFHVVDAVRGDRVFSGQAPLHWAGNRPEKLHRFANYTGADVYRLDFPDVNRPGRYFVQVEGVGCSYPFEIRSDAWEEVATTCLRGFYHHRSGIALGEPYTDFWRPRPYHPDDGMKVHQSNATLLETTMGMMGGNRDSFAALIEEATDEILPDAWGGMMDAGDWDRRVQHLSAARWFLELAEMEPDFCAGLNLNIPESGNNLPDVIDEALWILDFFVRIQEEDGGGRGGVEAAQHPAPGDTSWTEMLPVFAYAPDFWSTHQLVATAARAAWVLRDLDPDRAARYTDSALRGMVWAEREYAHAMAADSPYAKQAGAIEIRNLAALELYRLTGDENWHTIFEQDTVLADPEQAVETITQRDALFVYQGLGEGLGREEWKALARRALISDGDRALDYERNNAWSLVAARPEQEMFIGFPAAPLYSHHLVRAHYITGEADYLEKIYASTQFGLGANPDNNVYTTGLGSQRLQWVLHEDSMKTGRLAPPGIVVCGPFDQQAETVKRISWFTFWLDSFGINEGRIEPQFNQWPVYESYIDMWNFGSQNEYTPWQTMAEPAYVWSYLAAQTEDGSSGRR